MNNLVTLRFQIPRRKIIGGIFHCQFGKKKKKKSLERETQPEDVTLQNLSRAISTSPIPHFISIKALSLIQRHPNLKCLWSPHRKTDRKIRVSLKNGWKKKVVNPEQGTPSYPAVVWTGTGVLKRPHAWFGSGEQNNPLWERGKKKRKTHTVWGSSFILNLTCLKKRVIHCLNMHTGKR